MKCTRLSAILLLFGCAEAVQGPGSAPPDAPANVPDAADMADAAPPQRGMNWPASQQFPSFAPIDSLDVIASANRPADVRAMLVTMQGVVNREQPRIYVTDDGVGDRLWLAEIGAPITMVDDPFALVAKYRSELAGLIVYDPALPDTLNLATTIAGQTGAIVVSPTIATTLSAPPYSLTVEIDLRDLHLTSKLAVYQYELDHYAGTATHRMIIGLTPDIPDHLRDYAVATRSLAVWLDPRDANEHQMLSRYLALLPPNSPYLGWWANEPTGVAAAASAGVPVYAADWSSNLTVLGGTPRGSAPPPPATGPPPLEKKVYVAIFMSDGDNLQEDQHLIPIKWGVGARGSVPMGWTVSPALVDVAPVILRYYQRTASLDDVLVAGPSGLGYTYPAAWPAGTFDSYTRVTGAYMAAAGMHAITVWNNGSDLADADALAYARNIPGLYGMTIQDESHALRMIDTRVPLVRMALSYGDSAAILEQGIDAQLASFNSTAPVFVAVQGNMNMGAIDPAAFAQVADHYAGNGNVVFVRPDHFLELVERATNRARHQVFVGDFDGDGKSEPLFYYAGDGNWWMAHSDGTSLAWHNAGNASGFGDLLDGTREIFTGDFNGDGKTDVMFYYRGDGHFWLGISDGNLLAWHLASDASGFGNLLDGAHRILTGDFNGDGKTDVFFYNRGDGHLWLGISDGNTLTWHQAGDASGFGSLLDGSHPLYVGDFNGDGKRDLMFYYEGDGTWWMGLCDGQQITWHSAGNTQGFGNLIDRTRKILIGDFDGDRKTDVLFHYEGDGNWWLGRSDGNQLTWSNAGTTSGMIDWSHRLYAADFDGDGRTDILAYDAGLDRWSIGASNGTALVWHVASDGAGLGNLLDPSRIVLIGDFDGNGRAEPLAYGSAGTWSMGHSDGTMLLFGSAGDTSGFGDLTR